jgi:hypothetical protein
VIAVILIYDQFGVHSERARINLPGGLPQQGGFLARSCPERRGSIGSSILRNTRHTHPRRRLGGEKARVHKRANPDHETRQGSLAAE